MTAVEKNYISQVNKLLFDATLTPKITTINPFELIIDSEKKDKTRIKVVELLWKNSADPNAPMQGMRATSR